MASTPAGGGGGGGSFAFAFAFGFVMSGGVQLIAARRGAASFARRTCSRLGSELASATSTVPSFGCGSRVSSQRGTAPVRMLSARVLRLPTVSPVASSSLNASDSRTRVIATSTWRQLTSMVPQPAATCAARSKISLTAVFGSFAFFGSITSMIWSSPIPRSRRNRSAWLRDVKNASRT